MKPYFRKYTSVFITSKNMYNDSAMVRTFERKIIPPKASEGKDAGYLTIRCRKASAEDMESIKKGEKKSYFGTTEC